MGSTKTEIINGALARIGEEALASTGETSAEASISNAIYEQVREKFLTIYPWKFTLIEVTLAQKSAPELTTTEEWAYAHTIPNDCLRVVGLVNRGNYNIHGTELYTQFENPKMIYIRDIDEGYWPSYFVYAMTMELASAFAIPLTENTTLSNFFAQEARREWMIAKGLDSQTTPPATLSTNIDSLIASWPTYRR